MSVKHSIWPLSKPSEVTGILIHAGLVIPAAAQWNNAPDSTGNVTQGTSCQCSDVYVRAAGKRRCSCCLGALTCPAELRNAAMHPVCGK